MGFPTDFLDEIRARVSLPGIVGRRVKLTRKGREHSGLCPFHNEKTPSFTVSEDKGFYHCFGCGAHGDVISFVMQTEGLPFPEAVERLAGEAGLEMPRTTPEERARAARAASLHDAMERAAKWFESELAGPGGAAARVYLKDRGLDDQTVARFRIGLAPDAREKMKTALMGGDLPEKMLVEAGLLIRPDDGRATFDRFRHRVMFPITDRRGRVIAFGGRALGDHPAKYMNSPDTPLFNKGQVLYGFAQARERARKTGRVVVTEGYMDVIALSQGGVTETVAPLGTALTESQLEELWRLADEPILCFDGDAAGKRAAARAAERALPLLRPGRSLRFVWLPEGDDPDSLIRREGKAAVETLLDSARPLDRVIWEIETTGAQFDTPERRAALRKRLENRAAEITDGQVQAEYRAALLDRYFDRIRGRRGRGAGRRGPQAGEQRPGAGLINRLPPETITRREEEKFLRTVIRYPVLLDEFAEPMGEITLQDASLDKLRQEILKVYADLSGHDANSAQGLESSALTQHLKDGAAIAVLEGLTGETPAGAMDFAGWDGSLERARSGMRGMLMHLGRNERVAQLEEAERAFAEDDSAENWDRWQRLIQANREAESDRLALDEETFPIGAVGNGNL